MKNFTLIGIITLFTFIILLPQNSVAQQTKIDSLISVINKTDNDSIKINLYNSIGEIYERHSLDSALIFFKKALNISLNTKNKPNIADIYNNIGLIYEDKFEYDTALLNYSNSEKYCKLLNDTMGLANVYSNIGGVYKSRSNYDKALSYHNKSLELRKKINDNYGMAANYHNIATIYVGRSKYDEGIEYYYKAVEINKKEKNLQWLANNYSALGNAYQYKGVHDSTVVYYKKAIDLYKKLNNDRGVSLIYNNLAFLYTSKGDYTKALNTFNKALEIAIKGGDKPIEAACYSNMGIVYYYQGSYNKTIEQYKKALKIDIELGNIAEQASKYNALGSFYNILGSDEKATKYLLKAIEMYENIGNKGGIAGSYHNLADIFQNKGEYDKAIEYYNKAIKINAENGRKDWLSNNYGSLGNVYQLTKDYNKAKNYYNKSLKIKKELGDKKSIIAIHTNIAHLYIEMAESGNLNNNLDTAFKYLNTALPVAEQNALITDIHSISGNLATVFWMKNNIDSAEVKFNRYINIDNKNILMNFSFLSENEKEQYIATITSNYWKYNSFALKNRKKNPRITEMVYNNTIKNKGLLLKSNTAMRNAIYTSNNSTLKQDYDEWVYLKQQIAKKYSNGSDATILVDKADSLEANLVKSSNEFSDFKKVQNITWKEVQKGLKQNEVAIEFIHFPLLNPDSSFTDFTNQIQYVALVVTSKSKYPEMIPLFKEKQLKKIIGKFGGNNYSYINSIYGKNTKINKELYNLIWKPMEGSLKGAKKIYLSPDGLLHKISFSAIAKEQNVYLCDAYNIEMKSTTGKITEQNHMITQGHQINTATLFGGINYNTDSTKQKVWNYLDGTKTETQKINKILKKGKVKVNYYTNNLATEEEFKLMASNSNILHIATHGFFYPDPKEVQEETEKKVEYGDVVFRGGSRGFGVNTFVENENSLMRSGLVFAGANDVWSKQTDNDTIDDGVLTAQEVANIDMRNTNLVVMSACETGLGDIKGSEGVYGLQRAFKMAGVQYEIMSLWQVPDKETEEFMTTFYKNLVKQNNLPEDEIGIKKAFAETQKKMRTKYDPYFWAAFVLIE